MIPIFRAKNIDSDEYVQGYYYKDERLISGYSHKIHTFSKFGTVTTEIDEDTLSIHFPDMVDSNGNKIFASLQEDGKGGDVMQDDEYYGIAKYKDSRFIVEYENVEECLFEGNFEVIGVQE